MANRYWVAPTYGGTEGVGNWSNTANWSTTSGGSGGASVPVAGDNIFFSRSGIFEDVKVDVDTLSVNDITSNNGQGGRFDDSAPGDITFTVTGNITSEGGPFADISFSLFGTGKLVLTGSGKTITATSGVTEQAISASNVEVTSTASLTLNSTIVCTWLTQTGGTINLGNGMSVQCERYVATGTSAKTLNFGTLGYFDLNTGGFSIGWNVTGTNLTVSGTGIIFNGGTAIFNGGGVSTYPQLLARSDLRINGSNTFKEIGSNYTPKTITFQAGSTNTVTDGLYIQGSSSSQITSFRSSTTGTRFNLSKSSGTVDVSYLDIKDSNATGGATWIARNSTDSGNNLGWIFPKSSANFFMFFS